MCMQDGGVKVALDCTTTPSRATVGFPLATTRVAWTRTNSKTEPRDLVTDVLIFITCLTGLSPCFVPPSSAASIDFAKPCLVQAAH